MSQGCNFINSWVSASRRRSTSVTRPSTSSKTSTTSTNSNQLTDSDNADRRASSSNDLVDSPSSKQNNKSTSGNEVLLDASNETICAIDNTQRTTEREPTKPKINSTNIIQPIEINIDSTDDEQEHEGAEEAIFSQRNYFKNLSENNIQLSLDNLHLEDECKNLENQVELMEQKLDELERKRFDPSVPRTLIENVLKQRKKLLELECQIYALDLDTSDNGSINGHIISPSLQSHENRLNFLEYGDERSHDRDDSNDEEMTDYEYNGVHHYMHIGRNNPARSSITSKFGSHIKPGQENTADILDAIPPSGPFQYKQYLKRASSGTDSSDYSQLPVNREHKHQLPPPSMRHHQYLNQNNPHLMSSEESNILPSLNIQLQQQPNRKSSPIRPDHFKDEFGVKGFEANDRNAMASQYSSSTASSSSPQ